MGYFKHCGLIYKISYDNLMIILSYDNTKVTIDLQCTSNLRNMLRMAQGFFWYNSLVKSSESVRKLVYDIPRRNLSTM